ncbi:hypothetical protein [Paludibacterium sp. B53371]|uniref:hypothetical protein n=1 Tax=Paludibacterium sp. B53371 TaxID=2806263 RepID=UPI001C0568D0|nr:hypothetical protein [Paludibacterium sp. B53371]
MTRRRQWLLIGLFNLLIGIVEYSLLRHTLPAVPDQPHALSAAPPPAVMSEALARLRPDCEMAFIRDAAKRLQITLLLSPPETMGNHQDRVEASARLLATGHFHPLQALLAEISQHPAALLVDELQLTRASQGRLDLQARVRCLQPGTMEEAA